MADQSLLLFFHQSSEPCTKLMKLIPKGKKVQYVDIDQVQQLPAEVVSVPCLVVDGKQVLLGKKAFDFFNEEDTIGCIDFGSKNSLTAFSTLDDDESNIGSGNGFSSINEKSMEDGIPEYAEENESKLDMDKLTAQRLADVPPPLKKE